MTASASDVLPAPAPKAPEDVFSSSVNTSRPGIARRDSRARPPPIRIEMSSPSSSAVHLPLPIPVPGHEEEMEEEEGKDEVPALPSPRLSFSASSNGSANINGLGNGHGNGLGLGGMDPTTPTRAGFQPASPVSPSSPWRPLESGDTYSPPPRPRSLHGRPPSWHRNSLEVPSFLNFPGPGSPTSPDRQRFEPTPHHGLHARNLSAHFPQPGALLPPVSPTSPTAPIPDTLIPDGERRVFGGPSDWQFGAAPPPGEEGELETQTRRGKRRGHHHKHSLSHNFFSFLDPTQTNPTDQSQTSDIPVTLSPATPKPVPMQFNTPSAAALSPLPPGKDSQTQALGWFTVIESVLGVGLWIEGQRSGWHSLTAIGYLVVFDAMGLVVNTVSHDGWRSLRRPYGSSRFTALLCFSQSLFLLFSASYIAKESLETALLGSGGHDHGGHGHDHGGGSESPFPLLLLSLAAVASTFSGAALGNHRRLVDATGTLFLPPQYLAILDPASFLANPYTLSVSVATAALAVIGIVVPLSSLKSFDAAASLALTLLTSSLAWPSALAFGRILLQTAPPAASGQMKALRGALREVADDGRVLGLGTFRCWAVDAGKPIPSSVNGTAMSPQQSVSPSIASVLHAPSPSVSAFMRAAATDINNTLELFMKTRPGPVHAAAHIPLIVTLIVHVHPDTNDREVLDITRSAWMRLNTAINGRGAGEGEVTVQVQRGWEGVNG